MDKFFIDGKEGYYRTPMEAYFSAAPRYVFDPEIKLIRVTKDPLSKLLSKKAPSENLSREFINQVWVKGIELIETRKGLIERYTANLEELLGVGVKSVTSHTRGLEIKLENGLSYIEKAEINPFWRFKGNPRPVFFDRFILPLDVLLEESRWKPHLKEVLITVDVKLSENGSVLLKDFII